MALPFFGIGMKMDLFQFISIHRENTWKNQYSFMIKKKKTFSKFGIERTYLNMIKVTYDNTQLISY